MSGRSVATATESRPSAAKPGRPEAAELIWRWRDASGEGKGQRTSYSRERKRGSLQAAAGVLMGTVFMWLGWPKLAFGVFAVATVLLTSALLSPGGAYALLDRVATRAAQRMGSGLMWLLMVPLFYTFFLPFGMMFRRGRRDRLKRFLEPDAPTYWEPHEGLTAGSDSHASQF